jgi:formate hydrogenlyase subunit 3/multisubunit Na+/H+ antiporter MnhD subunit
MSFNQGVYDASLAYGKFKNYSGAVIALIIGIILIIISIFIFVSYIRQPKTKTEDNLPPEQKQQNAQWWTGPMVFGIGLICFLTAFYYYKLVTTVELAPVVATQGALGIGSDISFGLRNIILGERQD